MAAGDKVPSIDIRVIKPVLRVYALTYLASTGQRILSSQRLLWRLDIPVRDKLQAIATILKSGTEINRFPTAAALIIAGATSVPRLVIWAIKHVFAAGGWRVLSARLQRQLRALCTFLFAWLAFDLLNNDERWPPQTARSTANATYANRSDPTILDSSDFPSGEAQPKYAGKTIELTLFAACRALDVLAIYAWTKTRSRKWHPELRTPRLARLVKSMADTCIFASSNTIIMYAWFYSPHRLPKAYHKWISSAAQLDPRLLQALRLCRQGDFVYGQDTGWSTLLQGLCDDLGLPREWSNPAKTAPIPCELYHCGAGRSCEVHALSRWSRGFIFAFKLYLPLQLLARIQRLNVKRVLAAFTTAARYSAFLATFITLFYYSVCLSRTRVGPRLFSSKTVTPQMWDSGLGVLAGCLTCGWSILIVPPQQRQEFAFFVAPRALATIMPRVYNQKHQRREQFIFATSATILLTAVKTGTQQTVRGVFGRMLSNVMQE
ncbi:hypothetical protein DV737_g4249, partial [Chaetothyriales sp. CBS 132003]